VADGTALATTRMYRGWPDLRDGYTKSLWAAAGSPARSLAVAAALVALYALPPVAAAAGSPPATSGLERQPHGDDEHWDRSGSRLRRWSPPAVVVRTHRARSRRVSSMPSAAADCSAVRTATALRGRPGQPVIGRHLATNGTAAAAASWAGALGQVGGWRHGTGRHPRECRDPPIACQAMSSNRLERLVNLTICLMSTRSYLSLWEIGERVSGYDVGQTEHEQQAFRRMFERDKEALRELGIPVEEGSNTSFRDEVGYRISPGDYALPEIGFDREELAALALANRLWVSAGLSGAGAIALHKLEAVGDETATPPEDLLPRVESPDAAFEPLRQAVRDRRPVRFPYLKAGAAGAQERRVQPWGVVSWHGHWYLAGRDDDRGEMRVFRLSRIRGAVKPAGPPNSVKRPADLDVRAEVVRKATQMAEGEGAERVARLRVRPGAAHALRRRARPGGMSGASPAREGDADGEGAANDDAGGAEVIEVVFTDLERMAAQVLWHGADVVVIAPPDLRDHVLGRLRARAAAGTGS